MCSSDRTVVVYKRERIRKDCMACAYAFCDEDYPILAFVRVRACTCVIAQDRGKHAGKKKSDPCQDVALVGLYMVWFNFLSSAGPKSCVCACLCARVSPSVSMCGGEMCALLQDEENRTRNPLRV